MARVHTWSYSEDGKFWVHVKCGGIHECDPARSEPPAHCLKCGEQKPIRGNIRNTYQNLDFWDGGYMDFIDDW